MKKLRSQKKLIFTIILSLIAIDTFSQKVRNHSFGFITENDSYVLMGRDGYYTNGLTLYYAWTPKNVDKTTIRQISIGQYMYNAKNGSYNELHEIDRPVTAYLFARYNQTQFQKRSVIQWGVDIGTIGPNSLGRQMQEFVHSTLGMYKPREWQFQLRNAFSVNTNLLFTPHFVEGNRVSFRPVVNANLGLTYTDVSASTLFQLGNIGKEKCSIFWNSDLNYTSTTQKENFFFFQPEIKYQIYNATVQGGLINKSPEIYTSKLNRIIFQPKLGWNISNAHMGWKFYLQYQSKIAKSQIRDQIFGGVEIKFKY